MGVFQSKETSVKITDEKRAQALRYILSEIETQKDKESRDASPDVKK